MKMWVDDIRTPPSNIGWFWFKTSAEAISYLDFAKRNSDVLSDPITLMSLDHDLGGDDTTRPIVLWCCENEWWPTEVVVHSANPVGIDWLEGMIERYKPHVCEEDNCQRTDTIKMLDKWWLCGLHVWLIP